MLKIREQLKIVAVKLVCLTCLLIAFSMMLLIMYRYLKTPTTTTIETTAYPIWDIEFPAITICNHNKVYLPSASNITNTLLKKRIKQEEIDTFIDLLPQLIRPSLQKGNSQRETNLSSILDRIGKTWEELMFDMMQPCSKMLRICIWLDQEYDCDKIFKPTKSSEGFCCSFNYHVRHNKTLNVDNSTAENENLNKTKEEELPGVDEIQSVPGAGRDLGLTVHFDLESEYYRGSIRPYIGASILIHHPNEFPEVDLRSVIIQPSQEVTVLLSGTVVESEPGVRYLPVELRNCLFKDEKKLDISSTYGYQSCVSQCRIQFIVTNCKCIPFYYPKIYRNVRTCGLEDIKCLQSIRKNISELQTMSDVKAFEASYTEEMAEEFLEEADCNNCFPLCSDNWYTLDTESAFMESFPNNMLLLNGLNINRTSTALIYFRDITCIKYKREKWKSWNDLVASLGGILGLCVGGSFVSVVEVIYFFIINRCFRKGWKKSPSLFFKSPSGSLNVDQSKKSENKNNIFFIESKVSPSANLSKSDEIVQCNILTE